MSFLGNYRLYSSGNEAHPNYHAFSGLVALASIAAPRVWLDFGYFKIYPNLYVALLGPAGNRKTTAKDICEDLLRDIGDIPISAEKVTKEKLINDIAEQQRVFERLPEEVTAGLTDEQKEAVFRYAPMTLMPTELSNFLGADEKGMIDALTTMYDRRFRQFDNRTKNRGSDVIYGPCINILTCTTPSWITQYLKADIISGGFSRRLLFVYERDKGKLVAFPRVTDEQLKARQEMIVYAQTLKNVIGPFYWGETQKVYQDWYESQPKNQDDILSGYYETKAQQVLRIAMLLSLSENPNRVLLPHHWESALGMLNLIEENLASVYSGLGRNALSNVSQKVIDLLKTAPEIEVPTNKGSLMMCALPEKELRGFLWRQANGREMDEILNHLKSSGRIGTFNKQAGATTKAYICLMPQ